MRWVQKNTFFIWLSDREAIKKREELGLQRPKEIVQAYREITKKEGGSGPAALLVKAGCTLKEHIPKIGPCHSDWRFLQDWVLKNDTPTETALIHVVPRILFQSFDLNAMEKLEYLASLRREYNLPEHHLNSFVPAVIGAGILLSHADQTGNRSAILRDESKNSIVTGTSNLSLYGNDDRWRLFLGPFRDNRLDCISWPLFETLTNSGCLAFGMEVYSDSRLP